MNIVRQERNFAGSYNYRKGKSCTLRDAIAPVTVLLQFDATDSERSQVPTQPLMESHASSLDPTFRDISR